jgi:hypothetical protein
VLYKLGKMTWTIGSVAPFYDIIAGAGAAAAAVGVVGFNIPAIGIVFGATAVSRATAEAVIWANIWQGGASSYVIYTASAAGLAALMLWLLNGFTRSASMLLLLTPLAGLFVQMAYQKVVDKSASLW